MLRSNGLPSSMWVIAGLTFGSGMRRAEVF